MTQERLNLTLQAMSVAVYSPAGGDPHPNKKPFRGVLTRVGTASDKPPGGSNGKRVILSREAAEKALPSLLGMGVNFTDSAADHDVRAKIGVITAADLSDDAIHIEGYLYAADFPQEVARIVSERDALGFSYEIQNVYVEDINATVLTITDCVFTGAAILYKTKAAYSTTSLAAKAEENHMDKEVIEMLKAQGEALKNIGETLSKQNDRIEAMEAAAAEAKKKEAEEKAAADLAIKAAADKDAQTKKMKEMEDKLAAQDTVIADLKAAATKQAQPADRKTLPPHINALVARAGVALPDGDKKLSVGDVDGALGKATGITTQQRIEVKNALERSGLLSV